MSNACVTVTHCCYTTGRRAPAQPRCTLQRREQRRIRWHRARGHAGGLSVPRAAARVCVRNFAPCTRHGCLAATASAKGPEVTHGPGPATTPKARAVPPQTATSPLPTHTAAHCPAQAEWQRMTRRSPPRGGRLTRTTWASGRTPRDPQRAARADVCGAWRRVCLYRVAGGVNDNFN